jgi:hypothetical protein
MDHAVGAFISWLGAGALAALPGWLLHRWIWRALFGDKERGS